jgi:hypothetical protein
MDISVAVPHYFNADPDPTFQFDPDPDPDPTTNFPPDSDPPMLQKDPLRLPPFHFNADADPDPASLKRCGTMRIRIRNTVGYPIRFGLGV